MLFFFKDENDSLFSYDETQQPREDLIPITEAEKDAILQAKAEAEFNALSYVEKRRRSYPPITDYLDAVVKSDQAQIDAYIAACLAVKAKYPKP